MPTETLGAKNVVQEPVAGVKAQAPAISAATGVKGPFSGPSEPHIPKTVPNRMFDNDRDRLVSQPNSSRGTDNMAMGDRGGNMKKSTAIQSNNNMGSSNISTTRKEFTAISNPPTSVTQ